MHYEPLQEVGRLPRHDLLRMITEGAFILILDQQECMQERHVHTGEALVALFPSFAPIIAEDPAESEKLLKFRNLMATATCAIQGKNKKGYLLDIITFLTDGCGIKYVTGTGQTSKTDCRVQIYVQETGVEIRRRRCSSGGKTWKLISPSQQANRSSNYSSSLWAPRTKRARKTEAVVPVDPEVAACTRDLSLFEETWVAAQKVSGKPSSFTASPGSAAGSEAFNPVVSSSQLGMSRSQGSTGSQSSSDAIVDVDILFDRYTAVSPNAVVNSPAASDSLCVFFDANSNAKY